MHLVLVRHAQTTSNLTRALDTALPGADLTDLGGEQVRTLAGTLREESVDAVWSSPALRARRTAEAIADTRGLEVHLREGLVEIAAGDWEMSEDQAHGEEYRRMIMTWLEGDLDAHSPGGEDGHAALSRVDAVVAEIVAADLDCAVAVAHGAILRAWCGARVADLPRELVRDHPLPNTGVVRLTGTTGHWSATHWDDVRLADRSR